jgi:competence protein ComEA
MKTVTQTIFGALAALTSSLLLAAVNINTATVDELKSLPGVGPAKAAAIVEYRSRNGNFKSVEELKQVKGIGDGIFNKLKDEATISAVPAKGNAKAAPIKK